MSQTLITKVNAAQRVDMIERGMNPLNPEHVRRYLAGNGQGNFNENLQRIKSVMGDKINVGLGHSKERDAMPVPGEYDDVNQAIGGGGAAPVDYRQAISQDMEDYVSSPAVPSGGLINLREQRDQLQGNKINLNEVQTKGNQLATNYFNSFIKSVQNPSTAANLAVFKALKALLESEKQLQGTQALGIFQKAVNNVTKQMYNQLKG